MGTDDASFDIADIEAHCELQISEQVEVEQEHGSWREVVQKRNLPLQVKGTWQKASCTGGGLPAASEHLGAKKQV